METNLINSCWPKFCIFSEEGQIAQPPREKLSVLLEKIAGTLFIGGNLSDMAGTLLAAKSIRVPAIALISAGAGLNTLAGVALGSHQLLRVRPSPPTENHLIESLQYGTAYLCLIGGLAEASGTLAGMLDYPLVAEILLITSLLINAASVGCVVYEGSVRRNNPSLNIPASFKFAASLLFTLISAIDSGVSVATDFSSSSNSTSTANIDILSGGFILIGFSLFLFALGEALENWPTSPNNEATEADLDYYRMQADYPFLLRM